MRYKQSITFPRLHGNGPQMNLAMVINRPQAPTAYRQKAKSFKQAVYNDTNESKE